MALVRERADVGDELHQILLADATRIGGHDSFVTGDQLAPRLENGSTDIALVGHHGSTILEPDRFAKKVRELGRAYRRGRAMAAAAAQLRKYPLALAGQASVADLVGEPPFIVCGFEH